MSISSIASNLDSMPSAIFDSKSLRHLGSSEGFQNFLASSPYSCTSIGSQKLRSEKNIEKSEVPMNFEDAMDYLHPQKRLSAYYIPNSTPKVTKTEERGSSVTVTGNSLEASVSSKAGMRSIIGDVSSPSSPQKPLEGSRNKQRRLNSAVGVKFLQGYESVDLSHLDAETKKLVEGLQARVIGLEKEVFRLRKENSDLSTKNKQHESRMIAVIEEQRKAVEAREKYERKKTSLQSNYQENNQIAKSLKSILTLQEEEFYDRVVKKSSVASVSNAKTRTSFKLSYSKTGIGSGSVPSIETIWDGEKRRKTILKANSIGKSVGSFGNLSSRKTGSLKVLIKE